MSNRKSHRRDRSFRRFERFVQQRLRRPNRSESLADRIAARRDRRSARGQLRRLLCALCAWSDIFTDTIDERIEEDITA